MNKNKLSVSAFCLITLTASISAFADDQVFKPENSIYLKGSHVSSNGQLHQGYDISNTSTSTATVGNSTTTTTTTTTTTNDYLKNFHKSAAGAEIGFSHLSDNALIDISAGKDNLRTTLANGSLHFRPSLEKTGCLEVGYDYENNSTATRQAPSVGCRFNGVTGSSEQLQPLYLALRLQPSGTLHDKASGINYRSVGAELEYGVKPDPGVLLKAGVGIAHLRSGGLTDAGLNPIGSIRQEDIFEKIGVDAKLGQLARIKFEAIHHDLSGQAKAINVGIPGADLTNHRLELHLGISTAVGN